MKTRAKMVLGIAAGALVFLLGAAIWQQQSQRYPELAWTNPFIESPIQAALKERDLEALRALGKDAARPLLKVLLRSHGEKDRGMVDFSSYVADDEYKFGFVHLAALEDASLNPVLLRMVEDTEVHQELSIGAVVALAWPGNREGFDGLCRAAANRRLDNDLRKEILFRLPRFRLPPSETLRDLLYESLDEIDVIAAGSLARMGDVEAPSLILECDGISDLGMSWDENLADAVEAITGAPADGQPPPQKLDREEVKAAMQAWLDAHPAALDTEFERDRRAYLEGSRRRGELALEAFEDVANAPEADLDVASAALLFSSPGDRAEYLERIHRLARLVERRIDGLEEPEAIIRALNETLLKIGRRSHWAQTGDDGYHLNFVLNADDGTCLGYSTLYLAIAERLDLPIHPVLAPFHVFARWDDGAYRRNIELTDDGVRIDDAAYRDGSFSGLPIPAPVLDRGLFLRNASKRDLLALLLGNIAAHRLEEEDWEGAIDLARRSLRLHDSGFTSRHALAAALFQTRLDAGEEVLEVIHAGLEVYPLSAPLIGLRIEVLMSLGRLEEALEAIDAGEAALAGKWKLNAARAICLSRLGRHEEAEALRREVLGDTGTGLSRAERLATAAQIDLRRDPRRAQEVLERCGSEIPAVAAAAQALLEPARGMESSPERTLPLIRRLESLIDALPESPFPSFSPSLSPSPPSTLEESIEQAEWARAASESRPALARAAAALRGRALLLLGNRAEARRALEAAEAAAPRNRETLLLRRDLDAER